MYLATFSRYWRLNLLTMFEYRANFLMYTLFTFIYHAVAIVALWVTLTNFPSINGWDFRETAFMYGLWMLGHAVHNTFFYTVGEVPNFVREGRFDRFLVRPLDPLFSALTFPQQVWPDELLLAIPYFCIVTVYAGVHVDAIFLVYVPLVALGGAPHRLRHQPRDRDGVILVHAGRLAALGLHVAGARILALSHLHLSAQRPPRARVRAAARVHELFSRHVSAA